jgi:2-keto-4-pentenoate hydratase/2-oxohepta-3-ene-1,7-dioic acid hydratase in catechol pathway
MSQPARDKPMNPSKIICVGRNYREHAKEMGNEVPVEPLLFLKPPSSLIADGDEIVLPSHMSSHVEFEGEIGLVIGDTLKDVSEDEGAMGIAGVVALNDVTARDLQRKDSQWFRAKGFDTFCAVGPAFTGKVNFADIEVVTRLNGTERQRAKGSDMVFSIPFLVSYISRIVTLLPGDLIATGTPSGVGSLKTGDSVEIELVGLSRVRNTVA